MFLEIVRESISGLYFTIFCSKYLTSIINTVIQRLIYLSKYNLVYSNKDAKKNKKEEEDAKKNIKKCVLYVCNRYISIFSHKIDTSRSGFCVKTNIDNSNISVYQVTGVIIDSKILFSSSPRFCQIDEKSIISQLKVVQSIYSSYNSTRVISFVLTLFCT